MEVYIDDNKFIIIENKNFDFDFDLPKDVGKSLKHDIEFIINSKYL